jgi:hypothetical protein
LIAEGKCPHCGDTSVNADKLYPNRDLRNAVSAYQRSTQAASAGKHCITPGDPFSSLIPALNYVPFITLR